MTFPAAHIDDELLSALVDDQLTPDEAAQVRAHLPTCPVCQERLAELQSVANLLRALPELEPPRDFALGPRLLVDPPNVIRLRHWYMATRAVAGTLAAAFVLLSAGALYVDSRPAAQLDASRPSAQLAPAAPAVAPQSQPQPAPTAASRAAAPALAPAAAVRASPAAGAGAAQPAPAAAQPDDQVAAATSVRTLPPTPTPIPAPTRVPTATISAAPASLDPAAPLRYAALGAGVIAALSLLAALVIRHRLRQPASQP